MFNSFGLGINHKMEDTQVLPKVGAPYYEGDQATCNTKERK